MDGERFDRWTKTLTTGTGSRRAALRLLAGGALAGILARLSLEEAAAGCGKVGDKCGGDRGDCCTGARCKNGRCRCKRGWLDCDGNGRCENLRTNPSNCGGCGTVCPSGSCINGACTCATAGSSACPVGCTCTFRRGFTETACIGPTSACDQNHTQCTSDADCTRLGSVCIAPCSTGGPSYCSDPCSG